MPVLIRLKEPPVNVIIDDEIKDGSEKEWDEIFEGGVLFSKSPKKGHNLLIPLWKECNIAFMQNVTKEEIEEQEKAAEEAAKRRGDPRGGSLIDTPSFLFPGGRNPRKQ